jgi:BlaI family penicillinase repressor
VWGLIHSIPRFYAKTSRLNRLEGAWGESPIHPPFLPLHTPFCATNTFVLTSTNAFVYSDYVKKARKPTEAELEILTVLWERGPSTVRDVFEALPKDRGAMYTTVLKLMQIMTAKDLVSRRADQRAHVYEARLPREQTQCQLLQDLVERAFGGSALRLVQQALSGARKASPEDLAEIRRLLDEFEGAKK